LETTYTNRWSNYPRLRVPAPQAQAVLPMLPAEIALCPGSFPRFCGVFQAYNSM
jgi:hypothetical protein